MSETSLTITRRFILNLAGCLWELLWNLFLIVFWGYCVFGIVYFVYSLFFNYEEALKASFEKPAKIRDLTLVYLVPFLGWLFWEKYKQNSFSICWGRVKEHFSYVFGGKLVLPSSMGGPPFWTNND